MPDKISFSDFQKLDIRVGTVVEASVPEWSHWVMKLKVDLGLEIGERTILAGIMKFYQPKELVGKQFIFVVNLEPKKIGPKEPDGTQNFSTGMMLAACRPMSKKQETGNKDGEKPILFSPWEKLPSGAKIR
ncbi:methionine--tRNA ligase [Candidatus Collierbacteria bacterium]|nr:methionine--tRNA ligase [Candidatus Collierbacteria bacterium]